MYWQGDSQLRIDAALQEMFPISAEKKVLEVKSVLMTVTESYHKYKKEYAKHLSHNPDNENLSEYFSTWQWLFISSEILNHNNIFPASVLEHAPLEAVNIYFDTATYDEIERDVKVTQQ